MPWKSVTIDDSIDRVGGNASIHVPEGDYLLEVTKFEPCGEDLKPNAKGEPGEPYMWVHFRILEGPIQGQPAGTGKSLRMVSSFKPDTQGRMGQVFAACGRGQITSGLRGKSFPTYASFVQLSKALEKAVGGQKVGAELVDNSYTNNRTREIQVNSQVSDVYSTTDYTAKKATMQAARQSSFIPTSPAQTNGTAAPVPVQAPAPVAPDAGIASELEALLAGMASESTL